MKKTGTRLFLQATEGLAYLLKNNHKATGLVCGEIGEKETERGLLTGFCSQKVVILYLAVSKMGHKNQIFP